MSPITTAALTIASRRSRSGASRKSTREGSSTRRCVIQSATAVTTIAIAAIGAIVRANSANVRLDSRQITRFVRLDEGRSTEPKFAASTALSANGAVPPSCRG
jgi:hypothetical protein